MAFFQSSSSKHKLKLYRSNHFRPPNLPAQQKILTITSCSAWGCTYTTYSYKLRQNFFLRMGVHVHPVHPWIRLGLWCLTQEVHELLFPDALTDVSSNTPVIDMRAAAWRREFDCFTSQRLLRYRLFKGDKTDLLTSSVTGKTTAMALETSVVNSG